MPDATRAITGSDQVHLALLEQDAEQFQVDHKKMKHTSPFPPDLMGRDERRRIAAHVVESGHPTLVSKTGELIPYEQIAERSEDIFSYVVPLVAWGKGVGFLTVVIAESRRFDFIDAVLLYVLGCHIAIAIENIRLRERMQELVLTEERHRIARELLSVIMGAQKQDIVLPVASETSIEKLTDKEKEVLALMSRGHSNEEIAQTLWITLKTAKTHVSHIIRKLGQKNRVQAIVYAYKQGLVEVPRD
ncbi:MAG: LuxR C-terminal-related transcriptional regulator [Candidatus Aquicultorales bacterium]